MKLKQIVVAVLLCGSAIVPPNLASAESLAGSEGDVQSRPSFGSGGVCKKGWDQYVAAAGHSAYASTPYNRMSEAIICGGAINAPSKAAAEDGAMANCKATLTRYKVKAVRKCGIAASK